MPDLSADDAIQALRGLPEDRQRAILAKLSPEVKSGIMAKLGTPATPAGPQPLARTPGNYASEVASGVGRGVSNLASGLVQTISNPRQTLNAMRQQFSTAQQESQKEYSDLSQAGPLTRNLASMLTYAENAPVIGGMIRHAEQGGTTPGSPESVGAAAEGITTLEAPKLAGEVVGPLTKGLRNTVRTAADSIADTGPKVTKNLVKDTKAAQEAHRIATEEHTKNLEAHKTATAAATKAAEEAAKTAEEHFSGLQSKIETAREGALKEGNKNYTAVNEELNPVPADMEKLHELYQDATGAIGEAQAMPPILKRVGEALQKGEKFTYEDMQKLYSDLGRETSKGNLPGSTFHAYDLMHEGVGGEMQRIADSRDMGDQLTSSRNYWRRMKQTFGKPYNPTDAASGVLTSAAPEQAAQATLHNRIRLLSSFDPDIAQTFENVTKARDVAKYATKEADRLSAKEIKGPGEAPKGTIDAADIQAAKQGSIANAADRMENSSSHVANAFAAFAALRALFSGNMEGLAMDAAVRGGYALGKVAITKALQTPSVIELLTNPTARDVAMIPEEMRGQIGTLAKEAKSRGISVSPMITKLIPATVPAEGSKTQYLKSLRDKGAYTDGVTP